MQPKPQFPFFPFKNSDNNSQFLCCSYCENALTPSLDAAVKELIKEIVYLQDRMFARDPIKARAKKRHVIGLREAKKYLSLKKVKMLIIAPDLEKSESKGEFT